MPRTDAPQFDEARLASLRGKLAPSANSARDLAATAQTACVRRRALAVVGASPDAAAERLGARAVHHGQSPFALQLGDRFEQALRRDGFGRLVGALDEQLGFPTDGLVVEDLDETLPMPHPRRKGAQARRVEVARLRRERTEELLVEALTGSGGAPGRLVRHPRLSFLLTDTVRDVEPDFLLVWPGTRHVRLGESKSFVDLRHRTDPGDLAATRQQLAVYALALEQTADRLVEARRLTRKAREALHGPWPGDPVAPRAVFALTILRRPQSMFPALGVEDVRRDVELVRRGLHRTPASLAELLAALPGQAASRLDDPAVLRALPVRYEPAWCLGQCPMASDCRDAARTAHDPAYFGGPTRSTLAPAGDLAAAHALACGAAAPDDGPGQRAYAELTRTLRGRIDAARAVEAALAGQPGRGA